MPCLLLAYFESFHYEASAAVLPYSWHPLLVKNLQTALKLSRLVRERIDCLALPSSKAICSSYAARSSSSHVFLLFRVKTHQRVWFFGADKQKAQTRISNKGRQGALSGIISDMSETNKRTLDSYNAHLQEYIDGTPHKVSQEFRFWIDEAIGILPPGSEVLEIGSAFGRDAAYMENKGLSVVRTDAAQSFVDYLNDNGQPARLLNVVTDEIEGSYDMVFASAVLLHLTPEELSTALENIHSALKETGILAFSVKRGSGSEWSDAKLGAPRFFQYWEPEPLREVLRDNGFTVDWSSGETDEKWLRIIAKPTSG